MADQRESLVTVKNLSKRFEVRDSIARRDGIRDIWKKKGQDFKGMNAEQRIVGKDFWALRDINFDVKKGETMGIIGVNGAGKTTLLKILTQILEPTTGVIDIHGRVSSLIGVGTGFHLELSGRENVYFNGALLGMSKSEITEKFDDIVEFSELGSFIDTPVKYYSSGMRSRLGFSVAMNLDAEVMIIDEALAVGDINFKKKSTEKMRNVAFTGKTVLFVSHQMSIIQDVCDRTMWLSEGRMMKIGETDDVVNAYLKDVRGVSEDKQWVADKNQLIGDARIQLDNMHLVCDGKKTKAHAIKRGKDLGIELHYIIDKPSNTYSIGYTLLNERGSKLFRAAHTDIKDFKLKKGLNKIRVSVPINSLVNGNYFIAADADIKNDKWLINPKNTRAKIPFTITGERSDEWDENREGIFKPANLDWEHLS